MMGATSATSNELAFWQSPSLGPKALSTMKAVRSEWTVRYSRKPVIVMTVIFPPKPVRFAPLAGPVMMESIRKDAMSAARP